MRHLIALGLALAMSACGPRGQPAVDGEPMSTPAAAQADAPDTPASRPLAPPSADAEPTPEFVGLWAREDALCEEAPWRFEPRGVSTVGAVSCGFETATRTAHGYAIQASCVAESPAEPYEIHLALRSRPRRGMTITGGPWQADTQLIFCGPLSEN